MKNKRPEPPTKTLLDDLLMHLERLFTNACQAVERCATDASTQINFDGSVDVASDFSRAEKALKDLSGFNSEAKKKADEIAELDWDAWFSDPRTASSRARSIRRETKKAVEYASKASHPAVGNLVKKLSVERKKFELAYAAYRAEVTTEKLK